MMPGKHLLAHALVVALLGASCMTALAAGDMTPRPQQVFSEKPRIEDYADYNAFLVDIMEYRRQRNERISRINAAKAAQPVDDGALASITGGEPGDTTDLYDIQGPESLDEALALAKKLPHPVYEEPERFGRTTSFSFPIQPMEGEDLSTREIEGNLQDLESVDPDVFIDPSAAELTAVVLADNPDNVDDTSDKKASVGSNDAYRPAYDPQTRFMTGSDGHRYWAPIYVKNEIGYTEIRVLDVAVDTFKN